MNVNTSIQIIFNYWIICLPLMGCLRYGLVIGCLWLWFISSMAHIIFDLYRLWLGSDMTWHDYLRSVPLPWLSISKVKTAVEKPMHCFKNFTDFRRKYFPQGVHLFGGMEHFWQNSFWTTTFLLGGGGGSLTGNLKSRDASASKLPGIFSITLLSLWINNRVSKLLEHLEST